jgi:hypothetical protein
MSKGIEIQIYMAFFANIYLKSQPIKALFNFYE